MDRDAQVGSIPIVILLGALVLAVLPLPAAIAPFKPAWVAVTLLYWSLAAPHRFSLLTSFCMGLGLDTLSGSLLGQHALALLLIVYISQRFHLRLRAFPISQLTLTVAALLALYQFVLFWVDGVAGRTVPVVQSWAPVASGTLLWLFAWTAFTQGRRRAPARL